MSAKRTDQKYTPKEFVFCGWRESKGQLLAEVATICGEGIEQVYHFQTKFRRKRAVGGVYTGAEFNEGGARGLENSLYARMWEDRGQIIEWTAKSEQAESLARRLKDEKNARKHHQIEDTLLPLRQQYASLLKRRDRAGLAALEEAVQRALKAPIRTDEAPR